MYLFLIRNICISQAMLRKTTHQRNSMKRTPVYDSYGSSEPSYRTGHESNVVYRSGGNGGGGRKQQPDSPEWSPNDMVRMSEKYGREGTWGGAARNGFEETSESVTAELAPGIVVEGYVADL